MAPLLFALALILQDAPAADAAPAATPDAPMATAVPRKQAAAPLPIQGGAISAPTDDYGYVAWCYGAIASYVELYDRAMPEVIRIERAWPTPSTEENISQVYPAQRDEGKRNLILFARAMLAAEKASPRPLQNEGIEAVRKGRAMWTGATSVPKAQLAQFWMSWSPPAKCEETAKALEARSLLFGQALSYNAKGVTAAAPPPEVSTPDLAMASVAEPAGSADAAQDDDAGVVTTPASDPAMVYAEPLPSEDPEVSVTAASPSEEPTEPVVEDADETAGVAEPEPEAAASDGSGPSAIDALLPVSEPETAPAAGPEPVAAPAVSAPPVAAPPAPQPAKPPVRKHKRGLRETLSGMRGRQ
jgi:hypothetical protein